MRGTAVYAVPRIKTKRPVKPDSMCLFKLFGIGFVTHRCVR